jgi:hypothetical protein
MLRCNEMDANDFCGSVSVEGIAELIGSKPRDDHGTADRASHSLTFLAWQWSSLLHSVLLLLFLCMFGYINVECVQAVGTQNPVTPVTPVLNPEEKDLYLSTTKKDSINVNTAHSIEKYPEGNNI